MSLLKMLSGGAWTLNWRAADPLSRPTNHGVRFGVGFQDCRTRRAKAYRAGIGIREIILAMLRHLIFKMTRADLPHVGDYDGGDDARSAHHPSRHRPGAGPHCAGGSSVCLRLTCSWWTGFSLAATSLQFGLDRAGVVSETMAPSSAAIAGIVLIVAGAYQWTPLKQACLRHCRSPLVAFLLHH